MKERGREEKGTREEMDGERRWKGGGGRESRRDRVEVTGREGRDGKLEKKNHNTELLLKPKLCYHFTHV